MSENEAFGLSIGLMLDRLPKQRASKCKAKIMEVIAEFDDYQPTNLLSKLVFSCIKGVW